MGAIWSTWGSNFPLKRFLSGPPLKCCIIQKREPGRWKPAISPLQTRGNFPFKSFFCGAALSPFLGALRRISMGARNSNGVGLKSQNPAICIHLISSIDMAWI
ncbi:hypothetical protein CDAR_387611 [Caerostris darwini]|uniref:Uncharacterized protein n=1 Tax=Caerostris darwini TaxID=1538125 RepID=A0AAV4TGS5_9ARAC|nr:hypothetical protein CDAR_387611 [Caerostris darwini]